MARCAFEFFEQLGERRALATLLNFRGNLAQASGRSCEAERYFERSLELHQALDDYGAWASPWAIRLRCRLPPATTALRWAS